MGKVKQPGSVPNKPLYSRISYLYQAALYLGSTSDTAQKARPHVAHEQAGNCQELLDGQQPSSEDQCKQATSRRLLTEMRATSLKTQIRVSSAMKHTVCKYCDSLLVHGETCTTAVENKSKGGKKPWADIMVLTCNTCGGVKRFPAQTSRQKRRPVRDRLQHVKPLRTLD